MSSRALFPLLLLALLASAVLPTGALAAPSRAITTTALDTTGNVGRYSSLALDAQSNPVVAYWDQTNGDLKLVYCDSPSCGTSTIRTLDSTGNTGQWPSLKLNSQGNPVIAYWTSGTGAALKLIVCSTPTCAPGSVTIRTIDNASANTLQPSLQLDVDDNPVISYTRSTNPDTGLWLAYCDDPACASHQLNWVVTVGTKRYSSLQLDSSGYPS